MKVKELILILYKYYKNNDYESVIQTGINNIGLIIKLVGRLIDNRDFDSYNSFITKDTKLDDKTFDINKMSDGLALMIYMKIILNIIDSKKSLIYNSKEEFNHSLYDIDYPSILADTKDKLDLFILFLPVYSFEAHGIAFQLHSRPQFFTAIDYEFNQREIALMQINCERSNSEKIKTTSVIWLINPTHLEKDKYDLMIKYLMRNKKIIKLLHGADSLDVPYMYNTLFNNDHDAIMDFTFRYIDTRFLCELFRIHQNEEGKCAIYDALLYFKTITKEKHDQLENTHTNMGPVENISWNINDLHKDIHSLKYAIFDVLFLKKFIFDIFTRVKNKRENFYNTYITVSKITQFVTLERKKITTIVDKLKKRVDIMNNYYFFHNGIKFNLINIFNAVIKHITFRNINFKFNYLISINYIRTPLLIIVKAFIYNYIANIYKVMEKKAHVFNKDSIDLTSFWNELQKYYDNRLIHFFDNLKKETHNSISIFLSKH